MLGFFYLKTKYLYINYTAMSKKIKITESQLLRLVESNKTQITESKKAKVVAETKEKIKINESVNKIKADFKRFM
jgi:hypothetical protein